MEGNERINQLLASLEQIHVKKEEDRRLLEEIKQALANNEIAEAMEKLQIFNERQEENEEIEETEETPEKEKVKKTVKTKKNVNNNSEESTYPIELQDEELEKTYLGLLLNNPKSISMYYFVYEDCLFDSEDLINIYKGVLFTEGAKYSSEQAKNNFNFGKVTKEIMDLKEDLKYTYEHGSYDFEKVYTELKKLFILRKRYKSMPIKETQDKIAEIRHYSLYDSMSVEEVEAAINQVTVTGKFKQAILNSNVTDYYYKEKIEYMFYDTMKTDTQNIGKSEEIKKTATIISNLAQNLNIFIGYTMQITETPTLPINLTINDLSESRTVKEVLDTLCLIKQIDNRTLKDYEYSLEEVSDTYYPLKEYKDPDERYYACVVDKNRAGSKPKVLFNLNLAYNRWVEVGYLRLKEQK